jgi:hypothetical protein
VNYHYTYIKEDVLKNVHLNSIQKDTTVNIVKLHVKNVTELAKVIAKIVLLVNST